LNRSAAPDLFGPIVPTSGTAQRLTRGAVHAALVVQARQGDREAFDALARLTGNRCMAIAFRILRDFDLADDAVQTAFVTAWSELRTLRDPDLFEPWLHRILTRACYAEARRRRRQSEGVRLLAIDPVHGHDAAQALEHRDQLERAFRRLTVEQRAVLVFHHYLGLPLPEVADRICIPLGTVKSRMYHAKQALRASLEADARQSTPSAERPA
jgi:RNA polymerase sigma-70 factor (ECF subfamily)